jgi:hypothetical protein
VARAGSRVQDPVRGFGRLLGSESRQTGCRGSSAVPGVRTMTRSR